MQGDTGDPTAVSSESVTSDTGTGGDDWRRICDGSGELKLLIRSVGHELVSSVIGHELGVEFLYVIGDCRYWVVEPLANGLLDWRVTRTGVLTAEDEESLSRELLYDRWDELAGFYAGPGNPGGYEIQYSNGASTIRCELACASDVAAPQALMDLTPVARDWFRRLWDAGEPLKPTDPIRVDILRTQGSKPFNENPCALEWSFPFDPAPLSRSAEDGLLPSRLIDDEESAAQLRALREQYLADNLPEGACNLPLENSPFVFYQAADPTVALSLWMRDAVPLELPQGGISLPDTP